MSDIKRILFVDDECENYREDFDNSFAREGIEIIYCKSKDEGINELNSRRHYDLILLDWFLQDPESNIISISFLAELRKQLFVPVFIWTHHLENYEQELLKETIPYPSELILGISKEEFDSDELQQKVAELYDRCKLAHLSEIYREIVHQKLEEVFFELSEVAGLNLIKIIKAVVGETNNIDWSNDLILNFIHRRIISDSKFILNIDALLTDSTGIPDATEEEIKKVVINKIMYYKPQPNRIRCGDLINLKVSEESSKLAVIVSPDCDLANSSTRFVELIELRHIEDKEMGLKQSAKILIKKFNHPSFYFLPSINYFEDFQDFVAILKSKIVLMEKADQNDKPYPQASKQLNYNDIFYLGGTESKLEFICSLSEPYKSDFLNHLHSHDLRVGIPDIKKLLS